MQQDLLNKIIEWDQVNWGKAIPYWERFINGSNQKVLELGGRRGGLSLWLALKGFEVICSDLENPKQTAESLHQHYKDLKIQYQSINALDIPYENHFDIIIFKSILGGISGNGKNENKQLVIDQIHKALKKGGVLLFAENLEASALHRFFRKRFVKWGERWNYLKSEEVEPLFANFAKLEYNSRGFLGAFGRSEGQRRILGKVDHLISPLLNKKQHYLVYGVAIK